MVWRGRGTEHFGALIQAEGVENVDCGSDRAHRRKERFEQFGAAGTGHRDEMDLDGAYFAGRHVNHDEFSFLATRWRWLVQSYNAGRIIRNDAVIDPVIDIEYVADLIAYDHIDRTRIIVGDDDVVDEVLWLREFNVDDAVVERVRLKWVGKNFRYAIVFGWTGNEFRLNGNLNDRVLVYNRERWRAGAAGVDGLF